MNIIDGILVWKYKNKGNASMATAPGNLNLYQREKEIIENIHEVEERIHNDTIRLQNLQRELAAITALLDIYDPKHAPIDPADAYRKAAGDFTKAADISDYFSWEEGFEALQKYVAEHGHSSVRKNYRDENQYPLSRWLSHVRTLYSRNASFLGSEHIRQLESLPGWEWNASRDKEFEFALEVTIRSNGGVMAVKDIETDLKKRNIRIPGQGTRANIITRLRRSPTKFIRVGVGTYALRGSVKDLEIFSNLVKEFHPSKNGNMTLGQFNITEPKQLWWTCDKNHVWTDTLIKRIGGIECPECYPVRGS